MTNLLEKLMPDDALKRGMIDGVMNIEDALGKATNVLRANNTRAAIQEQKIEARQSKNRERAVDYRNRLKTKADYQ